MVRISHPSLIRSDWSDTSLPWRESDLQAAIVQMLRRRGIDVAADQGGLRTSRRQAGIAKAAGMIAGEPDLRLYLPGGRLLLIELKARKGSLSKAQRLRHATLAGLGHRVHVVKASCPDDAVGAVEALLIA